MTSTFILYFNLNSTVDCAKYSVYETPCKFIILNKKIVDVTKPNIKKIKPINFSESEVKIFDKLNKNIEVLHSHTETGGYKINKIEHITNILRLDNNLVLANNATLHAKIFNKYENKKLFVKGFEVSKPQFVTNPYLLQDDKEIQLVPKKLDNIDDPRAVVYNYKGVFTFKQCFLNILFGRNTHMFITKKGEYAETKEISKKEILDVVSFFLKKKVLTGFTFNHMMESKKNIEDYSLIEKYKIYDASKVVLKGDNLIKIWAMVIDKQTGEITTSYEKYDGEFGDITMNELFEFLNNL